MNKVYENEMHSGEEMVIPAQTKGFVATPLVRSLPDVLPPQRHLKLQFRKPVALLSFADDEGFVRQEVEDITLRSGYGPRTFWDENAGRENAIVPKQGTLTGQQDNVSQGSNLKWRLLPRKYADAALRTHTPPNLSSCCDASIFLPYDQF
jgi:hypothetical protein